MKRRAAIRLAASGLSWERWDNFAEEWHPLPLHWSRREAADFAAGLCNCRPKDVRIEARALEEAA